VRLGATHGQEKTLIYEAASNILDLLNLVLGSLCHSQDDRQLLVLIGSIERLGGRVLGVEAAKRWHEAMIQMLDEPITDTDRVSALGLERVGGSHQTLIELDHRQGDECAVGPSRSLMNVLEGSVGLIAVPQAQLPKDGMTDLLVTKLQNLSVDVLPDLGGIDVGLRQVEVVGHQSDGPILEAGL